MWLWWRLGTQRHLAVIVAGVKPQLRTCRSVWEEPLLFPELVDFSACCSSGTSERGLGTPAVTPSRERMGLRWPENKRLLDLWRNILSVLMSLPAVIYTFANTVKSGASEAWRVCGF